MLEKMLLKSAGCNSVDVLQRQHDSFVSDPAAYVASLEERAPKKRGRKSRVDREALKAAAEAEREAERDAEREAEAEREREAAAQAFAHAAAATAKLAKVQSTARAHVGRAVRISFAAGLRVGATGAVGSEAPTDARWAAATATAGDGALSPAAAVDALLVALFPSAPLPSPSAVHGSDSSARLAALSARLAALEGRAAGVGKHVVATHAARGAAAESALVAARAQGEDDRRARGAAEQQLGALRDESARATFTHTQKLAAAALAARESADALAAAHREVAAHKAAAAEHESIRDRCERMIAELAYERAARRALEQADEARFADVEARLEDEATKARRAELANVSLRRGVGELSHALADEREFGGQLTQRIEELVGTVGAYQDAVVVEERRKAKEAAEEVTLALMDAKPEARAANASGVRDAGRSPSRHLPGYTDQDVHSGVGGGAKAGVGSNAEAREAAADAAAMDVVEANAAGAAAPGDDGNGDGDVDPAELELYINRYDAELMQWLQLKMDAFDEKPHFRASRLVKYGSRTQYETALCSSVAVRLRQARVEHLAGAVPMSPPRV